MSNPRTPPTQKDLRARERQEQVFAEDDVPGNGDAGGEPNKKDVE